MIGGDIFYRPSDTVRHTNKHSIFQSTSVLNIFDSGVNKEMHAWDCLEDSVGIGLKNENCLVT